MLELQNYQIRKRPLEMGSLEIPIVPSEGKVLFKALFLNETGYIYKTTRKGNMLRQ
jgi:hypothetical protein